MTISIIFQQISSTRCSRRIAFFCVFLKVKFNSYVHFKFWLLLWERSMDVRLIRRRAFLDKTKFKTRISIYAHFNNKNKRLILRITRIRKWVSCQITTKFSHGRLTAVFLPWAALTFTTLHKHKYRCSILLISAEQHSPLLLSAFTRQFDNTKGWEIPIREWHWQINTSTNQTQK